MFLLYAAVSLSLRQSMYCTTRLLARWVFRRPVDGNFFKKIVHLFIRCFINFSIEQALWHILDDPLFKSWLKACVELCQHRCTNIDVSEYIT